MSEFLGLAYFAEIPTVLIDVQRGGPSTGMPTHTQQSDILAAAYASHGDTRHVLLFPSTPKECFDFTADAFDLAERLQTPVLMMTDLELGMNDTMSEPLTWDENRQYDRGKVLHESELEEMATRFGRYKDVDGDGIPYRTIPGAHPTKGAYFTRGTSHDEYAGYTEDATVYQASVERLLLKWETAKSIVPAPEEYQNTYQSNLGILFFGTTTQPALEAIDLLREQGLELDAMRVKAFPFTESVRHFLENHDQVFVVEQNRDAQFRSLLVNELEINPKQLTKILNYDGFPITADFISTSILERVHALKAV
jgi:2-oxoglutarate ferredoxin oxidoreductase subunit alpha